MMNVLLCGNVFITKGRWRMKELVARFGKAVKGVLTGFDRIVFIGVSRNHELYPATRMDHGQQRQCASLSWPASHRRRQTTLQLKQ